MSRAAFIEPCLPSPADHPPSGATWLHEIKHDGFRVIARKDGERVRLYSRPGNDLTYRFRLIVAGLARLPARSCIIDGEPWPWAVFDYIGEAGPAVISGAVQCPELF